MFKEMNKKLYFILTCLFLSTIGFMLKLPKVLHEFDKELHFTFYFSAVIVLSFLYPKKWLSNTFVLSFFGVFIEFSQEYSNKFSIYFTGKKIHGRFDFEDIIYNILGLIMGLIFYKLVIFLCSLKID
jgi:VanZ family protein